MQELAKSQKDVKNLKDWKYMLTNVKILVSEEEKVVQLGQFIGFPINNWESWFLKVFPGHMALKLHRHYLNCSNH